MVTARAWRTGDGSEAFISYCLLAVTLDLSRFPVPQLQKRDTLAGTGQDGSGMAPQTVSRSPLFIS